MEINKVLKELTGIFARRLYLSLYRVKGNSALEYLLETLRAEEAVILQEHGETLRKELAAEIRAVKKMPLHEQIAHYTQGERWVVAILLVRAEN